VTASEEEGPRAEGMTPAAAVSSLLGRGGNSRVIFGKGIYISKGGLH